MRFQLIITVTDTNEVQVSGPLEDKILCYGLLEVAKETIRAHQPALVQPVSGMLRRD